MIWGKKFNFYLDLLSIPAFGYMCYNSITGWINEREKRFLIVFAVAAGLMTIFKIADVWQQRGKRRSTDQ